MYWPLFFVPVALIVYTCFRPSSKGNLPDGPRDLVPQKDVRRKLHIQLAIWAKTYGDFFSYGMGRSRVLVLSSVQAIEELLVKRGHIYSSRPTSSSQADIITGKARIVNMPYGEEFRVRRRQTFLRRVMLTLSCRSETPQTPPLVAGNAECKDVPAVPGI
jgi:hypothetical protein